MGRCAEILQSRLRFFGRIRKNARLFKHFMLPGRGHSERGRGPFYPFGHDLSESLLTALRKWREDGVAPEYLLGAHYDKDAQGNKTLTFTRKIFPYTANKTREGIDFPKTTSYRILAFLDTP